MATASLIDMGRSLLLDLGSERASLLQGLARLYEVEEDFVRHHLAERVVRLNGQPVDPADYDAVELKDGDAVTIYSRNIAEHGILGELGLAQLGGMTVYMYAFDHNPPHFHVRYGGYEAQLELNSFDILKGAMPPRPLEKVRSWAAANSSQLWVNWENAKKGLPMSRILDE